MRTGLPVATTAVIYFMLVYLGVRFYAQLSRNTSLRFSTHYPAPKQDYGEHHRRNLGPLQTNSFWDFLRLLAAKNQLWWCGGISNCGRSAEDPLITSWSNDSTLELCTVHSCGLHKACPDSDEVKAQTLDKHGLTDLSSTAELDHFKTNRNR